MQIHHQLHLSQCYINCENIKWLGTWAIVWLPLIGSAPLKYDSLLTLKLFGLTEITWHSV